MHTTEQLNTALAGRYVVDHLIGEGGMAIVYLARDIKHNRKVALKVLRPDLGAVVGVDRFLSEIQVTANLQHPNLLPLFDSGEANGLLFYVMPFMEGESLRSRIVREKQLPVTDAIQITTAVAAALDYAHRHGVIHRDLKPENILIHDGQPLVADFGIALAISKAGGSRITQTGLSLGTPQYMSPEQATGDRVIDARTDVYSLGAVAYEMLTGDPPHTGTTSQAVIARMLTEKPRSILSSRPNVPPHVASAVEQALEKLPADRWASAKELSEAMAGARPVTMASTHQSAPTSAAPAPAGQSRVRWREYAAWTVAAIAMAGATYTSTRKSPPPVAGRFIIDLPDSVAVSGASSQSVALSRDGRLVAILGARGADRMIYVRRLDDPTAQPVRGTEGAIYPSFSYDGRSLLFNVGAALKTVPVEGGTPQTLADSTFAGPSSWGEGRIVLYQFRNGLWQVSSDGGARRLVAKPDTARGIAQLAFPEVLPGGKEALATVVPTYGFDSARIVVVRLSDGTVTETGIIGRAPHYVSSGHVVYARPGGTVFAVPFSLRRRAATGPPVLLLEQLRMALVVALGVSQNGTIAYESGISASSQTMYFVDRSGRARPLKGSPARFLEPKVSPDGRRIVVRVGSDQFEGGLWIHDIESGTLTRITPDSNNVRGEWTRDGKRIIYVAGFNTGRERLSSVPWDGSAPATPVTPLGNSLDWAEVALGKPGGLSIVRRGGGASGTVADLLIAPTDSLAAVRPFMTTTAAELAPRVSPNGRLLAYSSDKSSRPEIYVTTLPGPGPHVQVSVDGGTEPIWSPDSRTLYYRGPTRMMGATIVEQATLSVARRDSLFVDDYRRYANHSSYDIMPNGREFLMSRGPNSRSTIYVLVNWQQLSRVRGAEDQR